jgi:hypothetical protein
MGREGIASRCDSVRCAVGIATGYVLDDRGVGVRVPVGSRLFSAPYHSDCPWGPVDTEGKTARAQS